MIDLNDVLLAMSNIPVDDPIAEIWGRGLQGGYRIIEYTGTLPIAITTNGDALLDYRIYGTDGGVGEPTENLIDASLSEQTIEIKPSTSYAVSRYIDFPSQSASDLRFGVYDENDVLLWSDYLGTWWGENIKVYDNAKYFKITIPRRYLNAVSLVEGQRPAGLSTRDPYPANYIPYGYKLPMTVSDQNLLPDNISQFNNGYVNTYGSINPPDATKKEKYSDYVSIVPNTDYTFAMANGFPGNPSGNIDAKPWRTIAFYKQDKTFISREPGSSDYALKPSPVTVTSPSDAFFVRVTWRSFGSEECPYLLPKRDIYPVYIGENQLDAIGEYRDYVDYGIQKIARKIREYTFTGNETFNLFAQNAYGTCWVNLRLYTTVAYCPIHQTTLRSSHFTAINNSDADFWYGYPQLDDACNFEKEDGYDTVKIFFRSTANFSTAEECKAYFKEQYDNGTPVKIWFVMKYTVGQYESTDNGKEDSPVPLPEIPTVDGTTIIDYDGTPKPSQMYVKYKGKSGGA